jgi:hypothetical protein
MLRAICTIAASLCLATISHAAPNYSESRIRSPQGDYWAYSDGIGSVSGLPGDHVYIRNSENAEITAHRTIAGWVEAARNGNCGVSRVEFDPTTGEYRIHFLYWWFTAGRANAKTGTVSVYRGPTRIDVDELRKRI